MDNKDFLEEAKKVFGEKISIGKLDISEEVAKKFGFDKDEIEKYPEHAWLKSLEGRMYCPVCGYDLFGIGGSFQWSIAHGYGYCSNCKKIEFKLYHYIVEGKRPFELPAITGF